MSFTAAEKQIAIDISAIPDDTFIETDRDMLLTILRNLIDNAIKFSYPHGIIEVKYQKAKDGLTLTINDAGSGMSNDQLIRLSEIYPDKSTVGTSGEQGSGIGLNLVYRLIKEIGVHSLMKVFQGKTQKPLSNCKRLVNIDAISLVILHRSKNQGSI